MGNGSLYATIILKNVSKRLPDILIIINNENSIIRLNGKLSSTFILSTLKRKREDVNSDGEWFAGDY